MNGVNETLLAKLYKKFGVEEIEEEKEKEIEKEIEERFKQMQTTLEELKIQVAKMQEELKADLLAIDKKIEELLKLKIEKVESLQKPEVKSEEELEERYVLSPKTGVIEKVKAKKADYIEAKPTTLKKEEKPKVKKDIIEAEDSTVDVKGNLFKRLKEIK
ncbi:MAG: hypothetical protein QXJ68_00265 [Methanocellales archaeon]